MGYGLAISNTPNLILADRVILVFTITRQRSGVRRVLPQADMELAGRGMAGMAELHRSIP
jgi:hypothetical protein